MIVKIFTVIAMMITATIGVGSYLSSLPVIIAESDDDVDGEFETTGYNNPLNIILFDVIEPDGNYDLNPSGDLKFNLTLEDDDTMEDIYYVEFVFYHVPSGSSITQTFINTTNTAVDGSAAVFRHYNDLNADYLTFIEPDGTTEARVDRSYKSSRDTDWGNNGEPSTAQTLPVSGTDSAVDADGNTVGAIKFKYGVTLNISRVARRAKGINTTSGAWYLGLRVKDGKVDNNSSPSMITVAALGESTTDPIAASDTTFTMNWYGEISAPGSNSNEALQFTNVTPGTIDMTNETNLNKQSIAPTTFWSNDNHIITLESSPTWDVPVDERPLAKGVTQASIVSSPSLTAPQTFGLRFADSDTFSESKYLDASEVTYLDVTETSPTDEDGISKDFYFWLGVSEEFQNGTYNGDITITIKNPN